MAVDGHVADEGRATLTSAIVAFCLESFCFGAFAVVYGLAVWALLVSGRSQAGRRTRQDFALFAASTALFVLALAHISLDMTVNVRTFLSDGRDLGAAKSIFLSLNGLGDPIGVAKFVIYVTQSLISDGFMVYRVYVVWDRSWRVIVVPTLILFADIVLGYVTSFLGSKTPAGCVNAFFVMSFVTNLIAGGLIIKRILMTSDHGSSQLPPLPLKSVRLKVIESLFQSAAIYALGSVSLAIMVFISPNVGFLACHSVFSSIIGLVFVLIVIRISTNNADPVAGSRRLTMCALGQGVSCTGVQDAMHRPSLLRHPIAISVSISTTSDRSRNGALLSCSEPDGVLQGKFGPEPTEHSLLSSIELTTSL